jgi:hypothetical protein
LPVLSLTVTGCKEYNETRLWLGAKGNEEIRNDWRRVTFLRFWPSLSCQKTLPNDRRLFQKREAGRGGIDGEYDEPNIINLYYFGSDVNAI